MLKWSNLLCQRNPGPSPLQSDHHSYVVFNPAGPHHHQKQDVMNVILFVCHIIIHILDETKYILIEITLLKSKLRGEKVSN